MNETTPTIDFKRTWKKLKPVIHMEALSEDLHFVRLHFTNLLALENRDGRDAHRQLFYETAIDHWTHCEELGNKGKGPELLEFLAGLDDDILEETRKLNLSNIMPVLNALGGA